MKKKEQLEDFLKEMGAADRIYDQNIMSYNAALATRQSLLTRLKNWQDHDSWHQFFETYWRLIYGAALKAGLTDTEAEEVVQETVIGVARKIKDFNYDREVGSFKGWLLQMTRWRIADQFGKRGGRQGPSEDHKKERDGTATVERVADPNSEALNEHWERDWQKNIVSVALERIKATSSAKHFQAFDLFVLKHWPAGHVAKTTGISVAQVYLVKFRMLKLLKAEVKRLETEVI